MSSQWLLSLLLLVTVLNTVTCSLFHCRRNGQNCLNGGTCPANGQCQCPTTHDGFQCGIQIDQINATACNPSCLNNGTCVVDGTPRCICTQDYYGPTCAVNRVGIACFGDRKIIHVNPVGFVGSVYIVDKRNETQCTFLEFANVVDKTGFLDGWTEGYFLNINDVDATCGNITTMTEGNKIIYERRAKVEFSNDIITNLDLILNAKCEMVNDTLRPLPGTVFTAGITNTAYQNTSTVNTYEPVVFTASTADDQPLGQGPILIGTVIKFIFYIPPASGFTAIIVEELLASDMIGGTPIPLVTNRCPTGQAAPIITSFTRDTENRTVTIIMSVFKFVSSDQISFTGTAKICRDGETACNVVLTCNAGTALLGLGRRKRESDDRMMIQETVRVTTDPSAVETPVVQGSDQSGCQNPSQPQQEEIQCLLRTEIIIVIALLASALLVLMIACIVLTWRLLRSRPKVVDVYPTDYQSSRSLPRLTPSNF